MNAVAEKLREARGKVANGWCQGMWFTGDHYCALGAILTAAGLGELWRPARDILMLAVGAKVPSQIAKWNDTEGRTQSEVLAAFDRAIEIAESGK